MLGEVHGLWKQSRAAAKKLYKNYTKYRIRPWDFKHYKYRVFHEDEEVVGQGVVATRTFETLQLSQETIQRFYIVFNDIDTDRSGEISSEEFYSHLRVDKTAFTERVFSMIDLDNSGQIDFREFVVCMWNYCTYDQKTLSDFAFSLYDDDNSGYLDMQEIRDLVDEVFGSSQENSPRIQRILSILDADGDGVVTKDEFVKFQERCPVLLFPAFRMQQQMRHKVLGLDFWEKEQQKRWSMTGGRNLSVFEILEAMDKVKAASALDSLIQLNAEYDNSQISQRQKAQRVARAQKAAELDMLPGSVPAHLPDIPLADLPLNSETRGNIYRYFVESSSEYSPSIADPEIPWKNYNEKKRPNPNPNVYKAWG